MSRQHPNGRTVRVLLGFPPNPRRGDIQGSRRHPHAIQRHGFRSRHHHLPRLHPQRADQHDGACPQPAPLHLHLGCRRRARPAKDAALLGRLPPYACMCWIPACCPPFFFFSSISVQTFSRTSLRTFPRPAPLTFFLHCPPLPPPAQKKT